MPNLQDIVDIADSLEKSPVLVVRDRCVAVRNRNTSCRRCTQVCHFDAVHVEPNDIKLSPSACVACGACTVVCPTEALVPMKPSDTSLMANARVVLATLGEQVIFACARISSKQIADPQQYVEVPCLGRVGEDVALEMAVCGATDILLVDGNCSTCKYGSVSAEVDATVDEAKRLLAVQNTPTRVHRASMFPEDVFIEGEEGLFGTSRRGFFANASHSVKDLAYNTAKVAIIHKLEEQADPPIGKRLRTTTTGTLPQFRVNRAERVINALDFLGATEVESSAPSASSASAASASPDNSPSVESAPSQLDNSPSVESAPSQLDNSPSASSQPNSLATISASPDFSTSDVSYFAESVTSRIFGSVTIDTAVCSACGMCAVFCPTGALTRDPVRPNKKHAAAERVKYLEFSASDCVQCGLCVDVCWKKCLTLSATVSSEELFEFQPRTFHLEQTASSKQGDVLMNKPRFSANPVGK